MSIIKGEFVSVWDGNCEIRTRGLLNVDTGEVESLDMSNGSEDFNYLSSEYFESTDGDIYEICTECHEHIKKVVMIDDNIGHGIHEELRCMNGCDD